MLRPYIKILRSKMKSSVLIIDVLLIKVGNTDGRMLVLHYIGILSFYGGHLENHPKWRVGPKILSVNILILNRMSPMNNIIPLPEGP